MLRVVGIRGRAGSHPGEFASNGLTQDDGAGFAQQRDTRGIRRRTVATIDRRTHFRRQVGGVDDVFDPDRDPVQRPARRRAVELSGAAQRQFGVEACPCMNEGFAAIDAGEAIAHDRLAGRFACGDRAHDLAGREHVEQAALRRARFRLR